MIVSLCPNGLAWSFSEPKKMNAFGIFKIGYQEPLNPRIISIVTNEHLGDQMNVGLYQNGLAWSFSDPYKMNAFGICKLPIYVY
jgi:hypothetical protein